MEKVGLVKNKKITSIQKLFNRESFEKIKNEGIVLTTKNKKIEINIDDQLFEKNFKKPEVNLYVDEQGFVNAGVTFPENADEAFIEYKIIERYETDWKKYGRIQQIQKNKIYNFKSSVSPGKPVKFRVTYFKGNAIRYSDATLGDLRYDIFQDPPEIVVLNNESIVLDIFNVERFSNGGYVKIFRKENEEIKKCIAIGEIKGKTFSFSDTKAQNLNIYEYSAEVYDNLGNLYETDSVKLELNNSLERKKIKILNDKEGNYILASKEDKIVITVYDIKKEIASINTFLISKDKTLTKLSGSGCVCDTKEEKIYFKIDNKFTDYFVQIDGYLEEKNVSFGRSAEARQKTREITDVSVSTNKRFENIIKWNYYGSIDSFIVTAKDANKTRVIEKLSHRKLNNDHIYCIDSNFSKERIRTEYIINGIDEFGKIISKARIIKNG